MDSAGAGFEVRFARGPVLASMFGSVLLVLAACGGVALLHVRGDATDALVATCVGLPVALLGLAAVFQQWRKLHGPAPLTVTAEGIAFRSYFLGRGLFVPWQHVREFEVGHRRRLGHLLWIDLYPWAPKPQHRPPPGHARALVGQQHFREGDFFIALDPLDIEPDELLGMLRRHHAQRRHEPG